MNFSAHPSSEWKKKNYNLKSVLEYEGVLFKILTLAKEKKKCLKMFSGKFFLPSIQFYRQQLHLWRDFLSVFFFIPSYFLVNQGANCITFKSRPNQKWKSIMHIATTSEMDFAQRQWVTDHYLHAK